MIVPAVVLAELYRDAGHNQVVDACLARETGIRVRDIDRPLARLVGGVFTGAKADSRYLADAPQGRPAPAQPSMTICRGQSGTELVPVSHRGFLAIRPGGGSALAAVTMAAG